MDFVRSTKALFLLDQNLGGSISGVISHLKPTWIAELHNGNEKTFTSGTIVPETQFYFTFLRNFIIFK